MKNRIFPVAIMLLACYTTNIAAQDEVINDLAEKIKTYHQEYPKENIYFTTDKEVYRPAENIWFKAQVASDNMPSGLSKGLKVKLFDNKGTVVVDEKFRVDSSLAMGNIALPKKLSDGYYTLLVHSTWMENDSLNHIYRKFIEIRNDKASDYHISIKKINEYFSAKVPITLEVTVSNNDLQPVADTKVKLELFADNKKSYKETQKTDASGKFVFTIPAELFTTPIFIKCTSKNKGNESTASTVIYPAPSKIKLSFFPEGGKILTEFAKQVVIKSTDEYGNYVAVSGEIKDSEGSFSTVFKTDKNGLGSVIVASKGNSTLKATLTSPQGNSSEYILPVKTSGTSMSLIKKTKDTLMIRLENINNTEASDLYCIAYKAGKIYWASKFSNTKAGMFRVPINEVPAGVMYVTIFNSKKEVVSSLSTYIDHNRTIISSVKPEDNNAAFNIKVNDNSGTPVKGSFSVAVYKQNENILGTDTRNFNTYLMKNDFSEYKIDSLSQMNSTIDMLLISSLPQFPFLNHKKMKYSPKDGISGFVTNYSEKPIPKLQLSLFNKKTLELASATTDSSGYFICADINQSVGTVDYTITPTLLKKDIPINILLKSKFDENIKSTAKNTVMTDYLYRNYPIFSNEANSEDILYDPTLNAKRNKYNTIDQNKYNSSKTVLELIAEKKSYTINENKMFFANAVRSFKFTMGVMFVIDSVLNSDDITVIKNLNSSDIAEIRILTDPAEVSRYSSFAPNGIVEIITKKGNSNKPVINNEYKVKEFAAVQPFKVSPTSNTIFWNPNIMLDTEGKALVKLDNTNVKGKYVVNIAGFTEDGIPFYKRYEYDVK